MGRMRTIVAAAAPMMSPTSETSSRTREPDRGGRGCATAVSSTWNGRLQCGQVKRRCPSFRTLSATFSSAPQFVHVIRGMPPFYTGAFAARQKAPRRLRIAAGRL
jgi:hypothetical protein